MRPACRRGTSRVRYGIANIGDTVDDEDDCVAVFNNVLQAGAPSIVAVVGALAVVGVAQDFATHMTNTDDCIFYYTAETSVSGAIVPTLTYDSEDGGITASTATL